MTVCALDSQPALVLSPLYDYTVIAREGLHTGAGDYIAGIKPEVSVNEHGWVAFIATMDPGSNLFVGHAPGDPVNISMSTDSRQFTFPQINNQGVIIARELMSGNGVVRTWRVTNPGDFRLLASTTLSAFSQLTLPTIGNTAFANSQPLVGFLGREADLPFAYYANDTGERDVQDKVSGLSGTVLASFRSISAASEKRSFVAQYSTREDNGRVVIFSDPDDLGLYQDTLIATTVGSDWQEVGVSPGISDNGKVVAFVGNNRAEGLGIYVAVAATRFRDTFTVLPVIRTTDVIAYDVAGGPITLSSFDLVNRVGVMHHEMGEAGLVDDSIVLGFVATPSQASRPNPALPGKPLLFSEKEGIWTLRVDIERELYPPHSANPLRLHPTTPVPVAQVGDRIDGGIAEALTLYDPLAVPLADADGVPRVPQRGDQYVAFSALTDNGVKVVRAALLDTDGDGLPDHWETRGIDMDHDGNADLKLHEMGANPLRKDIFLEIDWLTDRTQGSNKPWSNQPAPYATHRMAQMFADAPVSNPDGTRGITLHIDAGPGFDDVPDSSSSFVVLSGSSGRAEVHFLPEPNNHSRPANDFLMTLGGFGVNNGGWLSNAMVQWRTLAHELGHTLGLRHGGTDHEAYKGNLYRSIMSYSYQLKLDSGVDSYGYLYLPGVTGYVFSDWVYIKHDFQHSGYFLGNTFGQSPGESDEDYPDPTVVKITFNGQDISLTPVCNAPGSDPAVAISVWDSPGTGTLDFEILGPATYNTWGEFDGHPEQDYTIEVLFLPGPTVTGVAPNKGSVGGHETVTVTGSGFGFNAVVLFAEVPATNVLRISSEQLTCDTPPGVLGSVTVKVLNADTEGLSWNYGGPYGLFGKLDNGFTYQAAPPPSPIQAERLLGTFKGYFAAVGLEEAQQQAILSLAIPAAGGLRFEAYAFVPILNPIPGPFDDPQNLEWHNESTAVRSFRGGDGSTYWPDIEYSDLNYAYGPVIANSTRLVGGVAAGSGQFTLKGPARWNAFWRQFGEYEMVSAPAQNWSLAVWHAQAPSLASVLPTSGSEAGGTTVQLTGSNFAEGIKVRFGGELATNVVVSTANTLTCMAPPGPAGLVPVEVDLLGMTSRLNNAFTYQPDAQRKAIVRVTFSDPRVPTIGVQTQSGRTYQLQRNYDLRDFDGWWNLGNPVTGNGAEILFTDLSLSADGPHTFYRVVIRE